jgi:starch-binding outer membrane protein, SusD/RagB family
MKQKNLIKCTVVAVLFIGLLGCNKILDNTQPPTSVAEEVALTTEVGVNSIRASMYSKIRSQMAFTTQYFIAPSSFTDELRSRPGATRYQNLNEAVGTSGTTHMGSWNASYNLIQDTNLILGAIEDGVLPEDVHNLYRGEAYAIRAFAMHHLARTYGYEPGMTSMGPESDWDLSVVIITDPVIDFEDIEFKERSTVDEVYSQIFSDLEQAKALLAGVNSDNTYITEAFVDALSARVHLYAGNWAEATQAAQDAINNSGRTLENTADGVANMFDETAGNHPEVIFQFVINPNTEGVTGNDNFVNTGPAAYTSTQWVSQVPTQFVIDKYSADDFRLGWYEECFNHQLGVPVSGCTSVNDNGWSVRKFNGSKGNTVDDMPYFRIGELYLIWAEAAAKAANDPLSGLAPLQELRDARNAGPVPAGALLSLDAFEDEILEERVRELIAEGHRFWDLKRLGRDVRNPNGSIKMFSDSYRILAPIGDNNLGVNENLIENPGY